MKRPWLRKRRHSPAHQTDPTQAPATSGGQMGKALTAKDGTGEVAKHQALRASQSAVRKLLNHPSNRATCPPACPPARPPARPQCNKHY